MLADINAILFLFPSVLRASQGQCLQAVGVAIVDTRDHLKQGRFFQQHVREILQNPNIHSHLVYYPVKKVRRQ